MDSRNISYADTIKDVACVLQQFNSIAAKYGMFVFEMHKLTVESNSGLVKITLVFNTETLHECIAPEALPS
jgi:hypothetical protein